MVYAVKILSGKMMLYNTLRNVPLSLGLAMFNLRDDVCLLLSHFMCSSSISDLTMTNGSNNKNNNNTNTTIISMAP